MTQTLEQINTEERQILKLLEKNVVNEMKSRGLVEKSTVVGFVCPDQGFIHAIRKVDNKWIETTDDVEVYLPAKLEKVITSKKRFIILLGGRGSAKSVGVADICLIDAKDNGSKTYFLREYQSSIKASVHSLLKEEVKRLEFDDFEIKQNSIDFNDDEVFSFAGLARNVESIKSAHGFKWYSVEEAQFITQESLKELTPTARNKPKKGLPLETEEVIDDHGVSMIFVANPGSSEDPFSKRFINPYIDEVLKNGFYEDDLHLIVMMNYTDNPWFHQSGLEEERAWDHEHIDRALYDHIWLGAFNDHVQNALIFAEWFDACIDAHLKLGWDKDEHGNYAPRGAIIASHDPSDTGPDDKGYALRQGMVFLDLQEKDDGDVNEGGHWAASLAIENGADYFTWDGDGMGIALVEQMSTDFSGRKIDIVMFRGSEGPDNPNAIYQPALKAPIDNQRTVRDSIKNKRTQYYLELRNRCYRTFRAVVYGEYHDPDTMISFSSEIRLLSKLRSEICRMPIKPHSGGLINTYTKEEMKTKFHFASPNLGDPVMMSLRYTPQRKKARQLRPTGWNG